MAATQATPVPASAKPVADHDVAIINRVPMNAPTLAMMLKPHSFARRGVHRS
jgi:hypothetical protein